jgi:hypothetical protein
MNLNFVAIDNRLLYMGIDSVNGKIKNIYEKIKTFFPVSGALTAYHNEGTALNAKRTACSDIGDIISGLLTESAYLIKSLVLYSKKRYGTDALSEFEENHLQEMLAGQEKDNFPRKYDSADELTGKLSLKTVEEVKDFSLWESCKKALALFMITAILATAWNLANRGTDVIVTYIKTVVATLSASE